ncbi:ComF family protein [Aestuariivirga sp.]|uniref:ComF family protein n=1 Tax=Aestuariivirga sp. TaxID=2650926 RepID=UPI0035936B18
MELPLTRLPQLAWRGFVDLVTPSQCLGCGVPVGEPASLCVPCWGKLQHIDEPVCDMLGTPFAYEQGPGTLSAAAIADLPVWDRSRAAVIFDEASRGLVHALKYQDRQEAGKLMARMMARAGRQILRDADVILPVPLFRWRLWRRRFNQSAYLAQQLSRLSGKAWEPGFLMRGRRTRSQVGLDHAERRKNVKGAFLISEASTVSIAGKSVLLVDDVRTTGATAEACAVVLKAAGARSVSLLSFALVPAPAKLHI